MQKRKWIYIFLLFSFLGKIQAQENVIYHMYDIPQTLLLNPAYKYSCRAFIELPVLSRFQFSLRNTGFGYNTIFTVKPTGQTIIDLDKMYNNMPKTNFLRTELKTNLLGFGFQVQRMYFTFNISNTTNFIFGLPRDILAITEGNYQNGEVLEEINLSNFGVDFINYTSISASASRDFYDKWRFGVRAKYIIGHLNLNTRNSKNYWRTDEDLNSLTFSTDIQLNSSLLLQNTGDSGLNSIGINENMVSDILGTINQNKGFGLDLGAIYNYNEKIQLSASITDLGMIFWNANISQFNALGEFTWSGLEISDTTDFDALFSDLEDSLINAFTFNPTNTEKYILSLPTKLYLAANYQLHERIMLGVVNKTMLLKNRPHTSLTFSANLKPFKSVTTSFTYSFMNNTYNNFGLGVAVGKRGVQGYLAAVNVPLSYALVDGIPVPYNSRTFNLQFGMNIIFGCKQKVKEIEALTCPQHRIWNRDLLQRQRRNELKEFIQKQKSKKFIFYKDQEPSYKKKVKRKKGILSFR